MGRATAGTRALDVAIIGAGAAGLTTAVHLRELAPDARVVVFDGAKSPGAKILVSGGARCNVTNRIVTEADFNGGSGAIIRRVLAAWPVAKTVRFFRRLGIPLHEEHDGKLFPNSGRSRDVLEGLLGALRASGAELRAGTRVLDIRRTDSGFRLETSGGAEHARLVVLATGGLSLPKTGSDGAGYEFARRFGHTIVPTTPALVPLVLARDTETAIHHDLSGVAQPVRLTVSTLTRSGTPNPRMFRPVNGALLWTHFGISGPAVLDISRHWLRARLEGGNPALTASLAPDETFASLEERWKTQTRTAPRMHIRSVVAGLVPGSVALALLARAGVGADETLADLRRDHRHRLARLLLELPLAVQDSRGYNHAEVTAGGIALREIDWRTMESRTCPGLYTVGEILDVDGRIGGFNFQWAWATARVAAQSLACRIG